MRYIVTEHFYNGTSMEKFSANSEAEAMDYINAITGGIADERDGKYYGKRNICGAIRTGYSIHLQ